MRHRLLVGATTAAYLYGRPRRRTVVITGGCGNLGTKLATRLLADGACDGQPHEQFRLELSSPVNAVLGNTTVRFASSHLLDTSAVGELLQAHQGRLEVVDARDVLSTRCMSLEKLGLERDAAGNLQTLGAASASGSSNPNA